MDKRHLYLLDRWDSQEFMITSHLLSEAKSRKVKSLNDYIIILCSTTIEAFHSNLQWAWADHSILSFNTVLKVPAVTRLTAITDIITGKEQQIIIICRCYDYGVGKSKEINCMAFRISKHLIKWQWTEKIQSLSHVLENYQSKCFLKTPLTLDREIDG